jgi:hypothetical protein
MNPPEILYHYTNAQGLLGILKTKKIWASSYRYMNDAQEFEYGFELIKEIYPKPKEYPLVSNVSDYSFAETIRRKKWDFESDCIFVASFSENGDLLSQWRGYTGPHGGYAIGFLSEILEQDEANLVVCEYDKDIQKNRLKETIDNDIKIIRPEFYKGLEKSEKGASDGLFSYLDLLDRVAVPKIVSIATAFKHPSFAEEKEWRLVVGPIPNDSQRIQYRPASSAIIPYIDIDYNLSSLPIKHIIVGPGPHKERNEGSLKQMLQKYGFQSVDVSSSTVPFRNW